MTATKAITLCAAAAFLISGLPALASADELALACTTRWITPSPSPDEPPYVFSVVIDPERWAVLTVGDEDPNFMGSGWITDRFSETTITAHFAKTRETGTISLDRVTGVVDMMIVLELPKKTYVHQAQGICEPSKKKF